MKMGGQTERHSERRVERVRQSLWATWTCFGHRLSLRELNSQGESIIAHAHGRPFKKLARAGVASQANGPNV